MSRRPVRNERRTFFATSSRSAQCTRVRERESFETIERCDACVPTERALRGGIRGDALREEREVAIGPVPGPSHRAGFPEP